MKVLLISRDGCLPCKKAKAVLKSLNYDVEVVDVTNKGSPTILASAFTDVYMYDIKLSPDGKTAFLIVFWEGLKVVDITTKTNPIEIGSFKDFLKGYFTLITFIKSDN